VRLHPAAKGSQQPVASRNIRTFSSDRAMAAIARFFICSTNYSVYTVVSQRIEQFESL
jgi:hypothetical protein